MHACMLSCFSQVQPFATLWTVALKAPLSMRVSRQEYWNGLPCPPPGNFSDPGIEPTSLMSPALAGRFFTTSATSEAPCSSSCNLNEPCFPALQNAGNKIYFRTLYKELQRSFVMHLAW